MAEPEHGAMASEGDAFVAGPDTGAGFRPGAGLLGPGVWEAELYEHLMTHAENERELLEPYQQAAEESSSEAFRYLVRLIIDDEIRHHRHFVDLANSLRIESELGSERPSVPRLDLHKAHAEEVIVLTRELLARERADARELKRLGKELRELKDTTLWSLLVQVMEADTAKHITILKFVERHARA